MITVKEIQQAIQEQADGNLDQWIITQDIHMYCNRLCGHADRTRIIKGRKLRDAAEKLYDLEQVRDAWESLQAQLTEGILAKDFLATFNRESTYYETDQGEHVMCLYLGTVMSIWPSGKYYVCFACGNVVDWEIEFDQIFSEAFEKELESAGFFMICEGTDVYATQPIEPILGKN